MTTPRLDTGSFRDREGRVFYQDGRVYRALSGRAFEAWRALDQTRFFKRLADDGKVVATKTASLSAEELASLSPPGVTSTWVAALEHERVPFISYPYEWSFSMLRDAALLQLELLDEALAEDFVLKDSSAYNVQFQGARPVFIDIASFEKLPEGDPWVGYLQFCQLFLYPLLLSAYRDLPFQPWLRGSIDGITPEDCNNLMSWRDRLRSGVLVHVYLQAKLQAGNANSDKSLRSDLQKAGFKKEMIVHNVRSLKKLVSKLSWNRTSSEWGDYATENTYDRENRQIKEGFVSTVAAERPWKMAWDLGANTGTFSRLVAEHAEYVVAFDIDRLAVERHYQHLKAEGPGNILPLISNLADASPPLGWRHQERKALTERGHPDLVLALALIHHIVITANIPLPEFVAWLASLGSHLVIEFVTKDDPMVAKLLRNKEDIYHDYEQPVFEACLEEHFEIVRRQAVQDGLRTLYYARPA